MSDERTLEQLLAEEGTLVFELFDQETAWDVGSSAVAVIRERDLAVAVQIVLDGHVVFKAAVGGADRDTDEWLEGKARTALHFGQPSLLVRRRKEADESVVAGLDPEVYRSHGGSVPILVRGRGVVGTITTSGAPDIVDHAIATEALRRVILK